MSDQKKGEGAPAAENVKPCSQSSSAKEISGSHLKDKLPSQSDNNNDSDNLKDVKDTKPKRSTPLKSYRNERRVQDGQKVPVKARSDSNSLVQRDQVGGGSNSGGDVGKFGDSRSRDRMDSGHGDKWSGGKGASGDWVKDLSHGTRNKAKEPTSSDGRDREDRYAGGGGYTKGSRGSRQPEKRPVRKDGSDSSILAGLPRGHDGPKLSEMKVATDLEAQWQKEEEEKKKKEEEKRKIEEEEKKQEVLRIEEKERKRKEEEENQRKAEEEQRILEEERKTVQEYILETKERNNVKASMRERNTAAAECRPDETFFVRLDSSLKKNTAFVKKLRNLTDSQKDSLTKEFNGLNLTKYVGEAAAAITEAKLKMSDVMCAVHICSLMHQRYADFSMALMENWQRFLLNKKDERASNPSKYRVDLRFYAELLSVRVFTQKEGLGILANQLSILVLSDKDEHSNLSILTSFCKHCGLDFVGLVPRKIRLLKEKHSCDTEIPRSEVLAPERQKACRGLLGEYYTSLCKHLEKDHKELKNMERQNIRILQTKGELNNERKEKYEEALGAYQKLYANTSIFADLIDADMPDLPDEEVKSEEGGIFDIFNPCNAEFQYDGDTTLFEDEDARTLYESLPDLKAFIPGILYKESAQSINKDEIRDGETGLEEDLEDLKVEDVEREMETEQQIAEEESKAAEEERAENNTEVKEDEEEEPSVEELAILAVDGDEDDTDTGSLMKLQYEAYITSLPNCVNRDLIDKAGIEFCMNFNTKANRKKLVRALFTVHRTRYDLLPFYARMVATLYPCMPDVANDLVQLLKGDFRWHVRKKDQINIESKLKTVRFIGEMVKFKLFPKSEALHCLKMLMFDFSHHNIEMSCALLETCGRFLYRSPDSHHRTKVYLDVMMRKKAALHLDSRYTTMIENAYYYSNPPEVAQVAKKIRPPMHEYIRKLLYKDLSKVTTEKVLRQMRKLDWDNSEVAFYATKCLTAVWIIRYNSIHCAANLLAGLAPYHEHVAIQVVDGVLEDMRIGMEVNHPKYNQRRVSCVKYLGELYNYRMVESSVIFKTLYSFITFGVALEGEPVSPVDPPEHLFRIRLVCILLETCGQYFDKGSSKKKLDCYLVYFQKYYWWKHNDVIWTPERPFPIDVENLVKDTMEIVRPKTKMCQSYEEAVKATEELENEIKPKIAAVLPIVETEDGESDGIADGDESGLSTIQESDEYTDELSDGLSQCNLGEEGLSLLESETSQEGTSQTYSNTGSGEKEEDENSDSDEDDNILESAGEDEADDQVTLLSGPAPKLYKCSEDEDFMTAFDQMLTDTVQARTNEAVKVPQLDIAVPMHLRGKNKKYVTDLDEPEEQVDDKTISFVLMTRKANKPHYSNLKVPISAEFAAKFKEREQAEKAEKEQMKKVVLGIHERQEEEDYQEMIASLTRPAPLNTNRERRVRYQHPKGAPDADLIFGSKKR